MTGIPMGRSLDLSPAYDEVCGRRHESLVDCINHLDVFHRLSSLLRPLHFHSSSLFRDLTSSITSTFPIQHLADFQSKSPNFNSGLISDLGDGDVRLLPARHPQRFHKEALNERQKRVIAMLSPSRPTRLVRVALAKYLVDRSLQISAFLSELQTHIPHIGVSPSETALRRFRFLVNLISRHRSACQIYQKTKGALQSLNARFRREESGGDLKPRQMCQTARRSAQPG
jgi:hypothetical protein